MEELINFYNGMPQAAKVMMIIFVLGIIFSLLKKFLKAAILFAVLMILMLVIMKLLNGV